MRRGGLYIHIPFCKSKCAYCDFISYANILDKTDDYLRALTAEMESARSRYPSFNPNTLYIGGGTPSILSLPQLKKLFESIEKTFGPVEYFQESTFEANPESLSEQKLKLLKARGINRLSLGLQSANNKELKLIGRAHNKEQFLKAYLCAQKYFDNINIDLIAALPRQTLKSFARSLAFAVKLKPSHISVYGLQVEEGTKLFAKKYVCDEALCRAMLEHAEVYLKENRYRQYEISNFAKAGRESLHNINYWLSGPYLGFGAAAASYIDGVRSQNTPAVADYIGGKRAVYEETLRGKAKTGERVLLALRYLRGFKPSAKMLKYFKKDFEELLEQKLLQKSGGKIRLSKEGKYFANAAARRFVEPFD